MNCLTVFLSSSQDAVSKANCFRVSICSALLFKIMSMSIFSVVSSNFGFFDISSSTSGFWSLRFRFGVTVSTGVGVGVGSVVMITAVVSVDASLVFCVSSKSRV